MENILYIPEREVFEITKSESKFEITAELIKSLHFHATRAHRAGNAEDSWETFWKDIVCDENGDLNLEALKLELSDYYVFMDTAAQVYCEVTGNAISKINTKAFEIIGKYHEELEENGEENYKLGYSEAIQDIKERFSDRIDSDVLEEILRLESEV